MVKTRKKQETQEKKEHPSPLDTAVTSLEEKLDMKVISDEVSPRMLSRSQTTIRKVKLLADRLNRRLNKLEHRISSINEKVRAAYKKHDATLATIYADELLEVREITRIVLYAQIGLEQLVMKLETVRDLKDFITELTPAIGVLRNIKAEMSEVFPAAERELGKIGDLLAGVVLDAGQSTGAEIDFERASKDADRVLKEAAAIAEEKMKEQFPEFEKENSKSIETKDEKSKDVERIMESATADTENIAGKDASESVKWSEAVEGIMESAAADAEKIVKKQQSSRHDAASE